MLWQGFLSRSCQESSYKSTEWDVSSRSISWKSRLGRRDTQPEIIVTEKFFFWLPPYTQLIVFFFELYVSFPSGLHPLWNIARCIIKLFIVMMLPSIFQPAYTDHISVPYFQCIIYLVAQCTLLLGRSSLFPEPARSPYTLSPCLVQHPYYVMYVITVSKELYRKP
jgi:hypothetical protein